ncbi:MFS transporter [Sphingomonas sp. HF-S4]|uniref:MFS transporter n=1 Tax=Sphingomonas agrestis TaxID=3080540 RepID=A0ABU3Y1T2_9SPHN|nr:MFS transporter [Sphingomonas sp. HF-S4]MDV3455356.1 MFS transporter [Sphingomonas sp. HF-S4]
MEQSRTRGWMVVAISLFGISTGPAAFGLASMGVTAEPLAQQFGWSRTAISAAVSIMMLSTAACMPIAGKLIDTLGARRVLIPSVVILAMCVAGLGFVQTYWQFIALYVAMGTIAVGTNSTAYMRVITTWFDHRRGLAIGIAGSGTGLGFAYVPVLAQALLEYGGWRIAYLGLGAVLLVGTLPLVLLAIHEAPGHDAPHDAPEARSTTGDSMAQAMRKPDFWVLGGIFVVLAFVLYGLIPHLVPLLQDRGVPAGQAAGIASLFGMATFGGRLLIGFMVDKHDARRIAFLFFSLSAIGLLLLALPLPLWAFLPAALLLGGSLGAEVDMLAYLTSRYFGLRCFAQIFSTLFAAVMVAMGLGPLAFGAVYDATGSYTAILAIGVPICLLASGLVLLLSPYGARARGGQISMT